MSEEKVTAWAEIMSATRETDCYGGDSCEELIPQWSTYCEGDKEGETFTEDLTLNPAQFPPGTRITVSIPVCPRCKNDCENCKAFDCDFDWKDWELCQYS